MANTTFKLNAREFNLIAPAYAQRIKRTLPQAINRKMAWVVRRALWYTPKADYEKFAAELGQALGISYRTRKGKTVRYLSAVMDKKNKKWFAQFNTARTAAAPLIALIINARRGREGKPGLYGAAMTEEIKRVIGTRARSIGFLKSGWLPALNKFRSHAGGGAGARGLPPEDRTAKRYGQPKGGGQIATKSRPVATIWNAASAKRDHKQALILYGKPALEKAFAEEMADLPEFMARDFKKSAQALGIKTR